MTYPSTSTKTRKTRIRNRLLRRLTPIRSRKVPWLPPCILPLVVGDRHGLPLRPLRLEILLLREAHRPGEEHRREALYLRVVGAHRVVVVLPGEGDLVLRRGELLLEVHEHPVGAELGVALGHGEEVADGAGEARLGLGLLPHALRLHGAGAGLGNLGQDLLLLAEKLLYAFEEVWDQVVAPLELDVYLAVRLLGLVLAPHEPVVGDDREDHGQHQNHYQDDRRHAHPRPPKRVTTQDIISPPTPPRPHRLEPVPEKLLPVEPPPWREPIVPSDRRSRPRPSRGSVEAA